jgi:uncharacterized protein
MTVHKASLEIIQDFLAQKRIAMVGISRSPADFSVHVFKELCRRGYDMVPVNPQTKQLLRRKCYVCVQDIEPPVDAALLMTPPKTTEIAVRDCAEAGIHRVWMHRAGGTGAVSEEAVQFCQEHNIRVIPGECPLMFLPEGGSVHRFHGFLHKITGRYPKHAHA